MIQVNEKGFVYDTEGMWLPPINLKQLEIFDCFKRYCLIHGPRLSGKTIGLVHKILRHAFDVDGARAAIVAKTLKNAKSAGAWVMIGNALPVWEQGCYGFKVVDWPRQTGDTKMSYLRIRNRHGTISEIQCHSLEHAQEVEAKFKGTNYSFFWLNELDQYCTEHAYDIICDSLRMTPYIPFEQHQVVADCNPPATGTNNWLHDRWFKFKDSEPKDGDTKETELAKDRLHRILAMIDDNPQLDPAAKNDLIQRYKRKKSWYARFVEGKWEADIVDGFFSDVYDEAIHVLGNDDGPEEERETIVPTPGCTVLLTGWDMGTSKNHSFHILEKIINEVTVKDPETGKIESRKLVSFSVLDELVVIRTYVSIREFTEMALEKMEFWEQWQMKHQKVALKWRHWSDTSAFYMHAAAEMCDAAIVYESSGGRIILDGAPKYRNSKRDRVKLVWQLMYEKRLHISAQLRTTRTMFANLRSGLGAAFIQEDDHKHPFDSMSYPISAEAPADMVKSAELTLAKQHAVPGLVLASM